MTPESSLPQVDLRHIRQHEASQQRAWEELCFILAPTTHGLAASTRLERRGTPDAGVEFSCPDPTGAPGRWGWQAKYLFTLDASAFHQMSKSVKDALRADNTLTRYIFMVPRDRTSLAGERRKGGLQRWEEAVEKWRIFATTLGMTVDFDYVGESDVLMALTRDEHVGALRYFFDEQFFSEDFFRRQVHREVNNLGSRYDPRVHVALDVENTFAALCRTQEWVTSVCAPMLDAARSTSELRGSPARTDVQAGSELEAALLAADRAGEAARLTVQRCRRKLGEPDSMAVRKMLSAARACSAAASRAASALVHEASTAAAASIEHGERSRVSGGLYRAATEASRACSVAEDVMAALTGREAEAATSGALLVLGPAGCGKSHLVADIAVHRTAQGLPTLLVLGQHLSPGQVWTQLAKVLDVPLSGGDLRACLEVAARVRGGGRALLIIDAVNEGPGRDLWLEQFRGFLSDVAHHPWLAVAVTVRNTYLSTVLPALPAGELLAQVEHLGLEGHEEEALARYAEHHGLRVPDLPPLLPELRNPLFLRSMCLSVKARGLDAVPREAMSLSWVFDGLLDAVEAAVGIPERLDVDPSERLVHRAVEALAQAMLDADTEELAVPVADAVCQVLYPERRRSRSLLDALVTEGMLLRDHATLAGLTQGGDVVRFTYQRLSDHQRALTLLSAHTGDAALAGAVRELARGDRRWARVGLLEALVLVVAERRGRELVDVLTDTDDLEPWLAAQLAESFFRTLPWRSQAAFTDRTQELLQYLAQQRVVSQTELLVLLISFACVPDHPLGGLRIDTTLRGMTLPQRDQQWSIPVLQTWGMDGDPVARTIDWASSTPTRPGDEVANQAVTLLAWFCTSPDRRLRDTATKAVVRLLDGQTRRAAILVTRFADVNDPYVVERVLAAAAGHLLRHRGRDRAPGDLDAVQDLGRVAHDAVFAGDAPRTTHALIRHWARMTVELADEALTRQERHLDRDLTAVRPPHRSPWPLEAPSEAQLAEMTRQPEGGPFRSSPRPGYDFSRYTIELGLAGAFVLPGQESGRIERRSTALHDLEEACGELRDHLPEQGRQSEPALGDLSEDGSIGGGVWRLVQTWREQLPQAAQPIVNRLDDALRRATDTGPVRPDHEMLERWVTARVLGLGWTSERFGVRDGMLAHLRDAGAAGGGTERFGKKYTWIAYHELVGLLGDHCRLHEPWLTAEPTDYESPHDVGDVVDTDPGVVLRGDEPPAGTTASRLRSLRVSDDASAWWLAPHHRRLSTQGDGYQWLLDTSDLPDLESLLTATDPQGDTWLVAESHATWMGAGRSDGHRRQLWMRSQASLVRAADLAAFKGWAPHQNWMGLWMPTPPDYVIGELGGYPDRQPWVKQFTEFDGERRHFGDALPGDPPGWQRVGHNIAPPAPLTLATSSYRSPASRDASATALPNAITPSPALMEVLGAHWSGADPADADLLQLGPIEREYSWITNGRIVAFCSARNRLNSTSALFLRADALHEGLQRADLSLWTWLLGEKTPWSGQNPEHQRTNLYAVAELKRKKADLWAETLEYVDYSTENPTRQVLSKNGELSSHAHLSADPSLTLRYAEILDSEGYS